MFVSPRISTRELALLCRRLATSLQAGVDVRTVWSREAGQATRPATRSRLRTISEGVSAGQSLPEAISWTDDFFPEMFRELVVVGDQTGHLAESFEHLAHHYDEQLRLRRTLLTASAWLKHLDAMLNTPCNRRVHTDLKVCKLYLAVTPPVTAI